jgi:hypothetical protein
VKSSIIPLISLGNEVKVVADSRDLQPGMIALANEARFTAAHYSEPLTAYVVGWQDRENIKATLDFIAPEVPVGRRFEFKEALNSEAFLSELDEERAIGSGFKRVEYKGKTTLGKTNNKGLTYRLDRDEDGVTSEQTIVARLTQRLYRNELRRAVTALLAIGNNTAKTWNTSANPDEDMRAAGAAAQLACGVFPNRGLIGLVAWNLRATAYAAQATAGAFAGLAKSAKEVAGAIGLDDIVVSRELYQSSGTAKTRIMTSTFINFYAEQGVGKDDPSHLKRFVSPVEGGGMLRVYREEIGPKFVDITVEHYSTVTATSTVGSEKLTIS